MASVQIEPGICGHITTVKATKLEGFQVQVSVESTCPHVWRFGAEVPEVDALREIALRGGPTPVLEAAYKYLAHAACPVPSGLVKAIEVAAGLALPHDVIMRIDKEE